MPSLLKEALTACRHSVSDTISFPLSGCFSPFPHGTGSLSVSKEYLAFEGGPPIFRQDFTCPALLDTSLEASRTGLSPALAALPNAFWSLLGLGWSPFARRYWGSRCCCPFLRVLRCFSSPGLLLKTYVFSQQVPVSAGYEAPRAAIITNCQVGCPIRKSMDHGLFPAPHGLSQGITSFIASYCQGIHQTPFSRLI